ncbi:MAG: c-type cytochrome [Opitutales bacterium]
MIQISNHFKTSHCRAFNWILFTLAILFLFLNAYAEDRSEIKIDPDPLSTTFSPEDSLSKIRVPNGFKLELVAAEPMIEEPVCMAWGPNGELYVAEMRSYMQDIDMSGELDPVSRVVKLVDLDGDGRMDQATTYLDNLVLPRAILTLDNKVLIGEPPHLWLCEDTNGDGKADIKVSIYENFSKRESGNVEHKINGLQWTMDNWIYNTKSSSIFRYRDQTIEERKVVFSGQWGQTVNDRGESIATKNSEPGLATIFPGKYLGDLSLSNKYRHLFERVKLGQGYGATWPIQGTSDLQGGRGLGRSDDGSLQRFTGACGQTVFRGDRLGDDMKGTYWVCEPVGRMIRCSDVDYDEGMITLHNRLEKQRLEFIASTDPNFRPVNAYTGPDGTLYFIDMYRGIIQHGNWTREGSYLREEILRRGLDKNVGKGRIYRLVREDIEPGPLPRLGKSDAKELVEALGHPNGWWRDEAQKLLVLRKETNAIPLLKNMVKQAEKGLARAHALWTLDGMGEWDESLVLSAIKDKNIEVRLAALRIAGERLLHHEASNALLDAVGQALPDDDLDIAAQRLMSLSFYKKQTKAHVVRAGHIEHVLNAAGKFIDKKIIAKAFMVALNSAEYIPALELLSKEARFQNLDTHPLPQHLAFACFTLADKEASFTALLDFTAQTQSGFRASLLEGFRLGSQGGRSVPRDLIRCKSKPSGLTRMEEAGVPEYSLAILYDLLTWPGDPKFKLQKALPPLDESELARFNKGREIYQGLCASCHGKEGQGVNMPEPQNHTMLAPSLAGSPRVNERNYRYLAEIILKGMTGPIDGVTYGGVMAPMEAYDNEWISSVMTYVRRSWGNSGAPVNPKDIEKVRGWNKKRSTAFTLAELNIPTPKGK